MAVKITMNPQWDTKLLNGMDAGLAEMMTDIDTKSAILAPVLTGALRNSRKLTRTGNRQYTLSYGDSKVPYARRRHFENKKHPQTIGYLAKAGDAVMRGDTGKYFRGKT